MKKIIFVGVFILSVVTLSACSLFGGNDLVSTSLGVVVEDQEIPVVLMVLPDYEMRTLSVNYSVLNELGESSESTTGVVGGEFFDRFEDIVSWLADQDLKNKEGMIKVELGLETEDVARTYSFVWEDGIDGLDEFQAFYIDLTSLFLEDIY